MEDAQRVKFAVYSTKGIRGIYVSEDDTAALVTAGFWEEELDFDYLYDRMTDLKQQLEDDNHNVYISGFPWLYTSIQRYVPEVGEVFVVTVAALTFLLWNYFRSWPGVWVPIFSGILSSIWALGMVPLLGLNLDPLVLVIPIFLSARALSHSVQSMDRYHEEYHRTGDKHTAIVESYSHLFPPAIASVLSDGIGILLVSIAPIPLIQKCAIFSSFWIVSIIISVVTLHPIILSATNPPGAKSNYPAWARCSARHAWPWSAPPSSATRSRIAHRPARTGEDVASCSPSASALYRWHEVIYRKLTEWTIAASNGWRRWAGVWLTSRST